MSEGEEYICSLAKRGEKEIILRMDWSQCQSIEQDNSRLSGAWVFRGTRVPVQALFENIDEGATVDEFLAWFPGLGVILIGVNVAEALPLWSMFTRCLAVVPNARASGYPGLLTSIEIAPARRDSKRKTNRKMQGAVRVVFAGI